MCLIKATAMEVYGCVTIGLGICAVLICASYRLYAQVPSFPGKELFYKLSRKLNEL